MFEIIEPVAEDAGFEVVDLALVRDASGWVLRVFLDNLQRLPDQPKQDIQLADCERMSRELSALLDVEDPVPCAYSLEVSSPGIDRPLRTAAHFERFLGEQAKVRLEVPIEGRRNFAGAITSVDDGVLVLSIDGALHRLIINDIASAKLVPDWDALLTNAKQQNQIQKQQKQTQKKTTKAEKNGSTPRIRRAASE